MTLKIAMLTVPRPYNYIHQSVASCFASDGDFELHLMLGHEEDNYLHPYQNHPKITLHPLSVEEQNQLHSLQTIQAKLNFNFYRALKCCSQGGLICEDDILFRKDWFTCLQQTLHEMQQENPKVILSCYSPSNTMSDPVRWAQLKRGKFYALYWTGHFYGNQALHFPGCVIEEVKTFFKERAFVDKPLAADLVMRQYFNTHLNLCVTIRALVQHIGMITSGLAGPIQHTSNTFDLEWPQ